MVPALGSAEGQSWAVLGTTMVTRGWRSTRPAPGCGCILQGGVSFWQSLTLEGDRFFSE